MFRRYCQVPCVGAASGWAAQSAAVPAPADRQAQARHNASPEVALASQSASCQGGGLPRWRGRGWTVLRPCYATTVTVNMTVSSIVRKPCRTGVG